MAEEGKKRRGLSGLSERLRDLYGAVKNLARKEKQTKKEEEGVNGERQARKFLGEKILDQDILSKVDEFEESLQPVLNRYSLAKSTGKKQMDEIVSKLDKEYLHFFAGYVLPIVNPSGKDITVYYPGAGFDVPKVLAATDGSKFIFVDIDRYQDEGSDNFIFVYRQLVALSGESKVNYELIDDNTARFTFSFKGLATNLPSTNLPSTNLPSTNLPSTNLPSTNLPSTNLPSTNLPSTNLPSTNLRGSGGRSGSCLIARRIVFIFNYK